MALLSSVDVEHNGWSRMRMRTALEGCTCRETYSQCMRKGLAGEHPGTHTQAGWAVLTAGRTQTLEDNMSLVVRKPVFGVSGLV